MWGRGPLTFFYIVLQSINNTGIVMVIKGNYVLNSKSRSTAQKLNAKKSYLSTFTIMRCYGRRIIFDTGDCNMCKIIR